MSFLNNNFPKQQLSVQVEINLFTKAGLFLKLAHGYPDKGTVETIL